MAHRPKPNKNDFGTSKTDRGSYLAAVRVWEKEHKDGITEVESNSNIVTDDNANLGNATITPDNRNFIERIGDNINNWLYDRNQKIDNYKEFLESQKEEEVTEEEKPPLDKNELKRKRLKKYGEKIQGGVLRYPAEALTEHTDYLQIDIERYEAIGSNYITSTGSSGRYVVGNAKQNRAGGTISKKLSKKPLINAGTILLPIPSNIEDSNNVVYGDSSLNGLAAAGVSAVQTAIGGRGNAATSIGGAIDNIGTGISEFKNKVDVGVGNEAVATDIVNKQIAASAVNIFGANVTVNQLLARGNGEIINPNMELLFGGPTLRNFRFNFKLTPRNEKEAEQVKLIIRAFKRNMAPQAQGGTLDSGTWFLKTPNVFKLRYRSGRTDHPFLHRFKQCFLSDMQVTYTGEGVYATYDDKTPVSMVLDLSFKEIEPIYDVDYDVRPGASAVGY